MDTILAIVILLAFPFLCWHFFNFYFRTRQKLVDKAADKIVEWNQQRIQAEKKQRSQEK
jgi:hypothetical protein